MSSSTTTWKAWGWNRAKRHVLIVFGMILITIPRLGTPDENREPFRAPTLSLDPNTAPARVLIALPLVGPSRAESILEARAAAPLESLGDLQSRVRGLGPASTAAVAPFLRFDKSLGESTSPVP